MFQSITTQRRVRGGITSLTLAGVFLLGSWSADVRAATVTKEGSTLVYRAAAGESNFVEVYQVRSSDGARYVFAEDRYGDVRVASSGGGCTSAPNGLSARCPDSGVEGIRVEAGDRADAVSVGSERFGLAVGVTVKAGGGDDALEESTPGAGRITFYGGSGDDSAAADVAYGGSGNDRLSGVDRRKARFRLFGGSGRDTLQGGGGGDVLKGGGGPDLVYGEMGRDKLYGGAGNDNLQDFSSPRDVNVFYGGGGNDRMNAFAGNNTFYGGSGRDSMYGAGGDDIFYARDRTRDFVSGGEGGRDSAQVDRGRDVVRNVKKLF